MPDDDRNPFGDHDPTLPPPGVGRWLLITSLVAVVILLCQLYPFDFGPRAGPLLALQPSPWWVVLAQVALFIPLGFAETQLARRLLPQAMTLVLLLVALDSLLLSLIGETAQHWVGSRTSSLVDLAANTLGGVIGYHLAVLFTPRAPHD